MLCGVFFAPGAPAAAVTATDPAFGYWLVENQRAIIQIHACGEGACGRVVWLANPFDDDGSLKTDSKNPDPGMRDRPLCGLELITGLQRDAAGSWAEGEIYSSRDGDSYSLQVMAEDPATLEVRGYVGVSLFGQSQYWTRVADARGGCPRVSPRGSGM